MNVTALLDVPTQRSVSPLDSAVGEDATDPAFANVMSRYQTNDNESLAQGASEPAAQSNDDALSGGAAPAAVAATVAPTEQTSHEPVAGANASGDALPPPVITNGQLLPLLGAAAPEGGLPDGIDRPGLDDALDTTDPSAAALIAVAVPAPLPISPTAAVVAVATPTADPILDPGAARRPAEPLPMAPAQAADTASSDPDPASALPPVDPARLVKKDGDAAAHPIAGTPDDDAPSVPGSAAHALRALGLAHGQGPVANGSPNPGGGASRDPNGSSGDPSRGDGAPKIANAHLATALEAAAQKDPATMHRDGSDSAIRTDASSQRPNGPVEGTRDVPTTRLGDLAQQHAPRFAAELADRVLVLRSQRFDSATVSLEPRDLGRIDIQVRVQADTTHVAFTTQHAAVRDALEGQMPRLRAMLEEAGLSLGNVDVSQSGNRGAGDPSNSRGYQPQVSAAVDSDLSDTSTRWQRRVEASLIDLHA